MPDTPPHARSDAISGASVLHEALVMRREVELELAEAGEIRAAALVEATSLLEKARLASAGVEEQAAADARDIVDQAREQAVGIVTQARVEAENLLAEAHADAAHYDAWARQEARERLSGELASLYDAIAERRDDLASSLPSLEAAIERAIVSLDGASWLGASLVDRVSLPDTALDHTPLDHTLLDHDALGPLPAVSLHAVADPVEADDVDPQVDHHDGAGAHDHPLGGPTPVPDPLTDPLTDPLVDLSDPSDPSDQSDPHVEPDAPAETQQWASVRLVSSSGHPDASTADGDAAADAGSGAGSGAVLVDDETAVWHEPVEAVAVGEVGDDRRHDPRLDDDEARPLGWLFRSPPIP